MIDVHGIPGRSGAVRNGNIPSCPTAAIYARCFTEEQTTENQVRELRAVAARHGWTVAAVFDGAGISGGLKHEDRPAMKVLLRAIARRVRPWARSAAA